MAEEKKEKKKTLEEILEEDKDFNESDYVYLYYGNIKHPFQPMGVNALYTKHLHDFYDIQKSRAEETGPQAQQLSQQLWTPPVQKPL